MTKHTLRFTVWFCLGALGMAFSGCGWVPRNHLDLYQRSVVVENEDDVSAIMADAELVETDDPDVNRLKIVYLKGTPYEMGFQQGRLLKKDIRDNFHHIVGILKFFVTEDMLDEVYDLMAPYIPLEEQEEMRGLAHGADLPLSVVHWVHAVPEVSEYGEKKRFRNRFKWLSGSSCSNVVAFGNATDDGELYQLRVLDWIRFLGAQKYPVIMVRRPNRGNASVSFSFAGFVGCVTGMNDRHMAFGEMGYGSPDNETLEGIPFVFLYRKLMREADGLDDAVRMIKEARRTCSYVYMISDAKIPFHQTNALLFVVDRDRVETYPANTLLQDRKKKRTYPPLEGVVYGGPKAEPLHQSLVKDYGKITPATLMEMTKAISLDENMQNVVFKPGTLEAWVSHATADKSDAGKACNQKWYYFNFGQELLKRK